MTTTTHPIKDFFSDAEWDAIDSAMRDYSDYGDEEAEIADLISTKISTLFS